MALGPADILALAEEQRQRAKKTINGELPPSNQIIAELVKDHERIMHDLGVLKSLKQQHEEKLANVARELNRLDGAREKVERDIVRMEWLVPMMYEKAKREEAESQGKGDSA